MDCTRITILIALSIKLLLVFIYGVSGGEAKERQYTVEEIREALKEVRILFLLGVVSYFNCLIG